MLALQDAVSQYLPRTLVFGAGVFERLTVDPVLGGAGARVLLVLDPALEAGPLGEPFAAAGFEVKIMEGPRREPHMADVEAAVAAARGFAPRAIVGIGGGSAMDLAKLVAALAVPDDSPLAGLGVRDVAGIGKLPGRELGLVCVPTTAGTGSEVSPNAIVLDESQNLKVGVISPYLVPDAAYVDPVLTLTVPRGVTAATGVDALTHCIEAYTSKFAHPMISLYALEGIRLIFSNLRRALRHPDDLAARSALLLGSLYGGICLGPVNTGAVHALAYPLGSVFHVAHGISNAVLLAAVLEFNLPVATEQYAQIALAMRAPEGADVEITARAGIARLRSFLDECEIPKSLTHFGVPRSAIPEMAAAAMKVTRLLDRNIRPVTYEDAVQIYEQVFE